MKKKVSILNMLILFSILFTLGILKKRMDDKNSSIESNADYNAIQKYLLNKDTLDKTTKPILWIHIPHEYNSRSWQSYGSRSSFNLNQPYLYLTVKSIIKQCNNNFTICLIDDDSFKKLLPQWNIDLKNISSPIKDKIRILGLMKLLYNYGGLLCPVSFLCIKDLNKMYVEGTKNNKMFICETVNRNVTSSGIDFCPNVIFCGAIKECRIMYRFIDFIQMIISRDNTDASTFLGDLNIWCTKRIENNEINLVDGCSIGTKTPLGKQIVLDDLMSNHYLDICTDIYGIYIPSDELLKRTNFGWFLRLNQNQVLSSNTIIGNYLLLSNIPDAKGEILEPIQIETNWFNKWIMPAGITLWGLKPNLLGNNLLNK